MNMQKRKFHPTYFIIFTLFLTLLFPALIFGASVKDLQSKRAAIQNSMNQRRQKIDALQTKAVQTQTQLNDVQLQLDADKNNLQAATQVFQRAQDELKQANRELDTAQTQFDDSRTQAKTRLVLMYERGDQGYMDILVSAKDFGDLLQRANLAKFMMDRDKAVLSDLKAKQDAVAQQVALVQVKSKDAEMAKANLAMITARTTQQRNQVSSQLNSVQDAINVERANCDKEEASSNSITAELSRLSRPTPSRGGSYGGGRRSSSYRGIMSGNLQLPCGGNVTSPFGMRYHPILHEMRMHTGVDIHASYGTPIGAAGAGVVIGASWRGGYGNCVMIDHGNGRVTLYAHMSSFAASEGDTVSAGQTIGYVGSTGQSTGPHLHFELRINGNPVNPENG